MKHSAIRFRTGLPDYFDLLDINLRQEKLIYGDVREELGHHPPTCGKPIILANYVDINLMHDILTGCLTICIVHYINATSAAFISKKNQ